MNILLTQSYGNVMLFKNEQHETGSENVKLTQNAFACGQFLANLPLSLLTI